MNLVVKALNSKVSKKVIALGLTLFVTMNCYCFAFASDENGKSRCLFNEVMQFLNDECSHGRTIKFVSYSEVPAGIIPLKVNSVAELKRVLGDDNNNLGSKDVVTSRNEGTCEYKHEFSRAGNKFGLLVTATYDVKNGDIPGPHLMDLMGICFNKRFENSDTNCQFSSNFPEMKVVSKGTLVSYVSIAGQTIEARDPIMAETTFYAYNH